MLSNKTGAVLALFLIFCLAATIAGCSNGGTGSGSDDADASRNLVGHIYLDDYQMVDDIELYDSAGNNIKHTDEGTDEYGMFICQADSLPAEFEVRVIIQDPSFENESAGSAEEAGNGSTTAASDRATDTGVTRLRAYMSNFDIESDFVDVNVMTTLICDYRDAHPGMSYDEAAASVKAFLEIPEDFSEFCLWGDPKEYFDTTTFLIEAKENGGINTFIASLIAEAEGGGTHPFPKTLGSANEVGDIDYTTSAIQIGQNVCEHFVPGSGVLFGMFFQAIGVDFGGNPALEAISRQLEAISNQITKMGNMLQESLKNYTNHAEYTTMLTTLSEPIAKIKTWNDLMNQYASDTVSGNYVDPANVALLQTQIKTSTHFLEQFRAFQVGNPGIQQQSAMLKLQSIVFDRFYHNEHYKLLANQFNGIQGYQLQELNLLVSAYTGGMPPDLTSAYRLTQNYWKCIKEEYSMLPLPLQNDTVILDRQNKILWTRKPVGTIPGTMPDRNFQVIAWQYGAGFYGPGVWRLPTKDEVNSLRPWDTNKNKGFDIPVNDGTGFFNNLYACTDGDQILCWNPQTGVFTMPFPFGGKFRPRQYKLVLVSGISTWNTISYPETTVLDENTVINVKPYDKFFKIGKPELLADQNIVISRLFLSPKNYSDTMTTVVNPCYYWESSDESIATVSNEPSEGGLKPTVRVNLTGPNPVYPKEGVVTWKQANKPVTITASRWIFGKKITYSVDLFGDNVPTVVPAKQLMRIGVYPKGKNYNLLPQMAEYCAMGVYSDGSFKNLTDVVTWVTTGGNTIGTVAGRAWLTIQNDTGLTDQTVTTTYQGVSGNTKYKGKQ